MNSQFVRQCMGLAVGFGLFAGCARPSAQTTQPPTVTALPPAPVTVVQAPAVPPAGNPAGATAAPAPGPAAAVSTANSEDPAPKVEQRIPPAQPANVASGVDEVAKLAQNGVNEEVILTFIDKYSGRFDLTADQIVYLNDLGVSSAVVTAMLKHDGVEAPVATAPATNAAPPQNVSNAPLPVNPAPQTDVQVGGNAPIATAPAAPSTEVTYFYDSLSPYGSWIYVSGYGWCWQPTVAVRVATWQPYCDSGRWYWSDTGWYWHSDYSWGWAPFHYGRWYRHASCGWIWTPGTVWGPAWVSWRYTDGYCGWAPLPPAAIWTPGVGLTFHGRHVDVTFDFGLHYHHYSFVAVNRFCDPHPYRHRIPQAQVVNVYRNTTVVNNYRVNNGAVVNNGVGRETIARRNPNDFRQVRVQQASFAGSGDRMNRIERRGNDLVAYRPQLPKDPPVKPTEIQNRMANQARVARAESGSPAGAAPRSRSNGNDGRDGVASPRSGALTPRPSPGAGAAQVPRVERDTRGERDVRAPRPERSSPAERDATPRATPQPAPRTAPQQRAPQERPERPNRAAAAPRNEVGNNVVQTPAARAPQVTTPRAQQNPVTPRVQQPAPRMEAPAAQARRVYPDAPSVTAPQTPRAAPSYSPRYNEQHNAAGRVPSYSAPAPSYRAPVQSAPSYSAPAPQAPRAAPEFRHGGGDGVRASGGAAPRGGGGDGPRGGRER